MDIEEKVYKVYKYTNLINGKIYIGRTKTSLVNRAGHNGKHYTQGHFHNAIVKYGWDNFKGEIIEDDLTYEEVCEKEKYYIALYDSTNPEKGYNLHNGGEGPSHEDLEKMKISHENKHLSEEHKRHISESLGQGVNNVNYGRKHSPETCKHIGDAKRGEKHPNWGKHLSQSTKDKIRSKVSRAIIQYDIEGNFIKEWENAKVAAETLGLNYQGIHNATRYMRHTSGGYKWEYKDQFMREKYMDNKYILENFGIRAFARKKEILNQRDNNQKEPSTTIPKKGVGE